MLAFDDEILAAWSDLLAIEHAAMRALMSAGCSVYQLQTEQENGPDWLPPNQNIRDTKRRFVVLVEQSNLEQHGAIWDDQAVLIECAREKLLKLIDEKKQKSGCPNDSTGSRSLKCPTWIRRNEVCSSVVYHVANAFRSFVMTVGEIREKLENTFLEGKSDKFIEAHQEATEIFAKFSKKLDDEMQFRVRVSSGRGVKFNLKYGDECAVASTPNIMLITVADGVNLEKAPTRKRMTEKPELNLGFFGYRLYSLK